jgi:hypothetical protein
VYRISYVNRDGMTYTGRCKEKWAAHARLLGAMDDGALYGVILDESDLVVEERVRNIRALAYELRA